MSQLNCLHCGKRLTVVKKFTSEEFCSLAHRHAYHTEQEQLALARLVEDQHRRKPARKQPLSRAKEIEQDKAPQICEYTSQQIQPRTLSSGPWASIYEAHFDVQVAEPSSVSTIGIARSGLASVKSAQDLHLPKGQASVEEAMALLSESQALLPSLCLGADGLSSGLNENSLEYGPALKLIVGPELPLEASIEASPLIAPIDPIFPESGLAIDEVTAFAAIDLSQVAGAQLPFDLSLCFFAVAPPLPDSLVSFEALSGLPCILPGLIEKVDIEGFELVESEFEPNEEAFASNFDSILRQPELLPCLPHPQPTLGSAGVDCLVKAKLPVEMEEVSISTLANAVSGVDGRFPIQHSAIAYDAAIVQRPDVPAFVLASLSITSFAGPIQRLFSRPKASAPRVPTLSCMDRIETAIPAALWPAQSKSARIILSRPQGKCEAYTTQLLYPESFVLRSTGHDITRGGLFSFSEPFAPKARIASVRRSSLTIHAKTFRASRQVNITVHPNAAIHPSKMREWAKPEKLPLSRPQLNSRILPARVAHTSFDAISPFAGEGYKLSWESMRHRWHEAPNDLRWIAMAVPIVIGLLWFAESPSAQDGAKGRLSSMIPNVSGLLNVSLNNDSLNGIKQNIQRRAAVELSDDFRQGLGEWSGVGNWSKGWTYDPAGFIRPRQVALFTPSLSLEDYRFEFLGAIERKALSWVFRAADVKNYHAARLEVTRGGPLPTVELVRYAVINGKAGPRKSVPLPMQARLDTIYRVSVDVRGNDFVTTVQGQVVDVFTDDRLPRGGIGFFSESGEDARLRWIEVSHQYDMLGRLCAYLVPYNVSNSNVRSAP